MILKHFLGAQTTYLSVSYLGAAGDIRHQELHLLVDQFALLPGDGLAALLACPHLVTISVLLPQSHAVLLGHVPTLRDLQQQQTLPSLLHTEYD